MRLGLKAGLLMRPHSLCAYALNGEGAEKGAYENVRGSSMNIHTLILFHTDRHNN